MKILLSGCSGFVGSHLIQLLTQEGHELTQLVREEPRSKNEIYWKPSEKKIDASKLDGFDAVIHLGGVNVAGKRWSPKFKSLLESSRVGSTTLLSSTLATLPNPPKHFICASAVGYYGDRGDEKLDEQSAAGEGFFPTLCKKWEAACEPARAAGISVANIRIGIVLGEEGALGKMKLPFSLGLGGRLGSGSQYWSWISIDDVTRAISFVLQNNLSGPVNIVAPAPATNLEFTKALGRALHRPTIFPVPAFLLKAVVGEFAEEGLLASTRVLPSKLTQAGFHYEYPELEAAMRSAVK